MADASEVTRQDVLFGEAPSTGTRPDVRRDEQWRLETLLLCNWGGFGGVNVIDVHHDSTLLAGASGAGKSTVLDAYTALINPNRQFNVASNDAGSRKTEGNRTTLTYVRGQYDRTPRDGVLVAKVLRGDNQDTWSALAAVFVASGGAHLTLLRLFFAGQEHSTASDMSVQYAIFDGRLERRHVESLEPLAMNGFRKDKLEKALPGLRVINQTTYVEQIQSKLHVGSGGDSGANALRLMHELQSGKPQPSVNELFKHMVLEEPITFAEADKAIASFDKLDDGYREIVTKEKQHEVLEKIENDHTEFVDAQQEISRIDTLRVVGTDRSPFMLWAHRRRAEAYSEDIVAAENERAAAVAEKNQFEGLKAATQLELDDANERYRKGGGDTREEAKNKITALSLGRDKIQKARDKFESKIRGFVVAPETAINFAEAQRQASRFLASYAEQKQAFRDAIYPLLGEKSGIEQKIRETQDELRHLKSQNSNIPRELHEVRTMFAAAAGLEPGELPFAGELIDMHQDHEAWRTAADSVLGGFATSLLVDERKLAHLRRSVNRLRLPRRLQFEGAPIGLPSSPRLDGSTLAGRLIVQDGPFAGWLRDRLDDRFDFECVPSADDLTGAGKRVTIEGQTQDGKRGAHGGNIQRRIGFNNDHRRAEVDADIQTLHGQLDEVGLKIEGIEEQDKRLGDQKTAWEAIAETDWVDIDVSAIDDEIAGWQDLLDALKADSPELDLLDEQRSKLAKAIEIHIGKAYAANEEAEKFRSQLETLNETLRSLQPLIDSLESDDTIRLSEEQTDHLDTKAGQTIGWDGTGDGFQTVIDGIRKDIQNDLSGAQKSMAAAGDRLVNAFQRFQASWPDPNRGVGLLSYEDYQDILIDLRSNGLAALRQSWSHKVIEFSGDRLSVLSNSYGSAQSEITERLRPIRSILSKIPFGNRDGLTLDIVDEHRHPESVGKFRRDLRDLATKAMNPIIDQAEAEAKFQSIRDVLARVRNGSAERTLLLDVRLHMKVTARTMDGDSLVNVYDHITEKSGGEAQMITAFICGAALRYQLGDENRAHPRFAPVVLDEAFIKADGRYTKLAVAAWRQLGFQLVVGAPEDKFNAIEPAMGLVIGITKDHKERSYATTGRRKQDPAP
jgi:uncharacterized protein YPO0396